MELNETNEPTFPYSRRWETLLMVIVVFLLAAVTIAAGFLVYRYISSFSKPPRNYYELQLRIWRNAVDKEPSDPSAHTNLGYIYLKMEKRTLAIEEFKKTLRLDPTNTDALYNLGNTYYKLGKVDLAIRNVAAAANSAAPGRKYSAYFRLGEIYEAQEKYDLALDAYQKSVTDDPTMWNSNFKLGLLLEKAGNEDKALGYYKKAATFNPANKQIQKAIERLSAK